MRNLFVLSLMMTAPLYGEATKTYICPTEVSYSLSGSDASSTFKYQGVGSDLDTTFVQAKLHSELDQEMFSCAYTWRTGDKAQFFLEMPLDPMSQCQFQGEDASKTTCPHGDLTQCVLVCTEQAPPS